MKYLTLLLGVVLHIVFASAICPQIPGYRLVAKNFEHPKFTGNYVSFDIYLTHTDTTRFEYAGGEFYLNFYTPVANGGILRYEFIEYEGSDLPPNLRPRDPKVHNNPGDTSQLGLSLNTFPGAGNGYIVPQSSAGIKIIRMLIYTTVPFMLVRIDFPDIHRIDLRLSWRDIPNLLSTKIYAYVGNVLTEITNPLQHSIDSSGLIIYPVELISFEHSVHNDIVSLFWRTATETNNSGFEVQRKGLGTNDWMLIGFVEGNGTTNDPKYYVFGDRVNTGKYNYRLKQIDYNGNFEFFNLTSEVVVGIPSQYKLSQNYPNPYNPVTKFDFQNLSDGNVTIGLYNNLGKFQKNLVKEFMTAGYYSLELNMADYPSGIYYYKLEAGNFSEVRKMILLK